MDTAPSKPPSLIEKRADFSGISNDKTNGPGAGVSTRTLRQGCLYEEEKYLSAVREEPDIYGKVCPTAGEALPERGADALSCSASKKQVQTRTPVCSQVLAQLLRVLTEENTCHSFLLCCFHIDGRIINEYTFLCTQRKPLQKGLIDSKNPAPEAPPVQKSMLHPSGGWPLCEPNTRAGAQRHWTTDKAGSPAV